MESNKHLEMLGKLVVDKVTGFDGVVSSISFDLYGCVQAVVSPPKKEDGSLGTCHWFDVTRLEITDDTPVMEVPDFSKGYVAEGRKGCAEKPML